MSVLQKIQDSINKILGDRGTKPVDVIRLRDHLTMTADELRTFVAVLNAMDVDTRKGLTDRITKSATTNTKMPGLLYYSMFRKNLAGDAAKMEADEAFSAIRRAGEQLLEVVDKILPNLEEKFNDKFLMVDNLKMSHLMLLGFINAVETFTKFGIVLFHCVVTDAVEDLTQAPKYQLLILEDNLTNVALNTTQILHKKGLATFLEKFVTAKQNDVRVVNDDKKADFSFIQPTVINEEVKGVLGYTVGFINIFRWIGERWNLYVQSRTRKIQSEREWLTTKVELLKRDLAGEDPNSEEYRKLVNIIESYNIQITDLDKRLHDETK